MSFKIFSSVHNGIQLVNLVNEGSHTQVSIALQHGAMLHAFTIATKNGTHNFIDNYSNAQQVQQQLAQSYKSSKLSPYACRVAHAKYTYDGQVFELDNKFADGNAIHGLLYNKAFVLVNEFADDQEASIVCKYNYKEEDAGYPFNYRCEVRYTLFAQNVLQIQTTVTNLDELEIPMADGWHPYFTLGGSINDWLLHFNATSMLEFNEKLIPTGKLLPYTTFTTEKPIGDTQLDNCFLLNLVEGRAACTLRNASNGLQVHFFPASSYPYLQIYTPAHRQSIAIENLSAAPDAFNNNMGLLMLQPRHSQTFTVYYQVNSL